MHVIIEKVDVNISQKNIVYGVKKLYYKSDNIMLLVLHYMTNVILIWFDIVYIDRAIFQISYKKYNMFKLIQLLHYLEIITYYNEELLNQ